MDVSDIPPVRSARGSSGLGVEYPFFANVCAREWLSEIHWSVRYALRFHIPLDPVRVLTPPCKSYHLGATSQDVAVKSEESMGADDTLSSANVVFRRGSNVCFLDRIST